jgi:hypothetical protein
VPGPTDAIEAAASPTRLASLEQTVQQLVHFISRDLRPDLGRSALQGSQAAKDDKDLKDNER